MLLFAHPRSGSSNLYQILQRHPALDILEEPFNENFVTWQTGNPDYLSRVRDIPSLDAQLAEIFASYNGIKVLDYQLDDALLEHLLLRPGLRVIFLRRRNLLQTVVSNLIAEQTHLWKKWDMTRPLAEYYANLRPLDLDDIHGRMDWLAQHLEWCEGVLDGREDGRVWKAVYEDFYFASSAIQAATLAGMWRFLDLPPVPPEQLHYYLRPDLTKLNSPATYAFLPNAQEIHERCGSDRYGWLFPA